ncbi:MAG: protein kinase [Myxococcales bacterium]|nr:protein kinase [Myxococcales bacterium]
MSREMRNLVEPGREIDHFRVIRLLGEGGFGEVYLARDSKLGRKVALKLIHPRHVGSREAIDRFLFEVRATARFNHPNIVTVYAVGEHRGVPYVALEYLEGQTLRERINEHRPRLKEALRMAAAIARALEEAHRHGILHRDLKPENVLIPADGRLRVVDFGLAKKIATPEQQARAAEALREEELPAFTTPTEPLDTVRDLALGSDQTLPPEQAHGLAAAVALGVDRPTIEQLTLASYQSEESAQVRGTPAYMSPEQWRGLALSSAADVWALGVMLFEMLGGTLPFGYSSPLAIATQVCGKEPSPSLPPGGAGDALRALVARCLDKDPDARPSAAQVAEALEAELGGGVKPSDERGPFRGLLPFSERDTGLYFGREAETNAFLERLRVEPTLAIVGPSGAGKSSFVHSGVVPRLREQAHWLVLPLRPGATPFRALANRLLHGEHSRSAAQRATTMQQPQVAEARAQAAGAAPPASEEETSQRRGLFEGQDVESLAAMLEESPERLALLLPRLAQRHGGRVLLLVDQLEELHTLTEDVETRRRFMRALAAAADDVDEPVRLVVTLRDDFLGRVAESEAAARVLRNVTVLRSPGRQSLRDILERPLAAFEYRYDDEKLPAEMIDAVVDEPACLPLLSFAAQQLWERRDREKRVLRRADYDEIGGVAGALATHADALLSAMAPGELDIARKLLMRLVTAEGTRRTVARAALVEGLEEQAERVLERLTEARLLALRKPDTDSEPHYELAHEALITRWERLAAWLDESADERAFVAEVGQAADLWHKRGRRDDEVWSGEALDDALRSLRRVREGVPELVRQFLERGKIVQKERESEQERVRRARRRTLTIATVVVLLAVSIFATAWMMRLRGERVRIDRERALALVAGAFSLGDAQAVAAKARIRSALELGDHPDARLAWWSLGRHGLRFEKRLTRQAVAIAFSRDDRGVWVLDRDGRLRRLALQHDEWQSVASLAGKRLDAFAVLADGRLVVSWRDKKRRFVALCWPQSGKLQIVGRLPPIAVALARMEAKDRRVCLAVYQAIHCWDVATQKHDGTFPGGNAMRLATRSNLLASTSSFRRMQILVNGKRDHSWQVSDERHFFPLAFAPDGRFLLHGSGQRLWRMWPSRRAPHVLTSISGSIANIAFAPQGSLVAVGTTTARIHLYSLSDGGVRPVGPVLTWKAKNDLVALLAFNSRGTALAASSRSGRLRIWDVTLRGGERNSGHDGAIRTLDVSSKGVVASGGSDHLLKLWRPSHAHEIASRDVSPTSITALRYSHAGDRLAVGFANGRVEVAKGTLSLSGAALVPLGAWVSSLAWSSDDRYLAAGGWDGKVAVYRDGQRLYRFEHHAASMVCALAISEDDKRLAVVSCRQRPPNRKVIGVYDLASGRLLSSGSTRSHALTAGAVFRGDTVLVEDGWQGVVYFRDGYAWREDTSRQQFGGRMFLFDYGRLTMRLATNAHDHMAALVLHSAATPPRGRYIAGGSGMIVDVGWRRGMIASGDAAGALQLYRAPRYLPQWSTLMVGGRRRYLYTRTHRIDLRRGVREPLPATRWMRALGQRGLMAAEHRSGLLCMADDRGAVEVWDTAADRQLATVRMPPLASIGIVTLPGQLSRAISYPISVRAIFAGDADECLVHANERLYVISRAGKRRDVGSCARFSQAPGGFFCQRWRDKVTVISARGDVLARFATRDVIDALVRDRARAGGWIVAGPADARRYWALMRVGGKSGGDALPGAGALLGRVTALMWLESKRSRALARRLLFTGNNRGVVTAFDARRLRVVARWKLHGVIQDIWQERGHVIVVSAQGDFRRIDISMLEMPYCQLMRDVWRVTPHVWREEGVIPVRPPKDHHCSRRGSER